MTRNYIGLACTWHDPATAIVDSRGEVVFAEAAERYLQKKRAHHTTPDDIIRAPELIETYCEPDADLVVARTWTTRSVTANKWVGRVLGGMEFFTRLAGPKRNGKAAPTGSTELRYSQHPGTNLMRYALEAHRASVTRTSDALWRGVQWQALADYVHRSRDAGPELAPQTDLTVPRRHVFRIGIDHHETHAAAACFTSPFDEAVCAIVDGYAELGSTGFYHYKDGRFTQLETNQRSWTSIGLLYNYLCTACGFDPIKGEEWKVMGLAPYGRFDPAIDALLDPILRVKDLHFEADRTPRDQYETLLGELASYPAADLARTAQEFFQRRMDELLGNLAQRKLSKNLILGGGCALNSAANGKYLEHTPFERLHVYSAPGDDGNALGAALLAYYRDHPDSRPPRVAASPYLGSSASQESVDTMIRLGRPPGHRSWPGRVHERTAELLAAGKIVGWFQGRAEFGPRALGNRSILADPRRSEIKDVLNERVKFREEFRPFAPSILHEHGPDYFEDYQDSPYMERTLRFRDAVKSAVPGVVHVDGTGRLQSVTRERNERFYDLIEAFYKQTGVPVLLNTSFNVMGKPIVHSVEDAVAVFYTSGLDVLVIGDEVIEK